MANIQELISSLQSIKGSSDELSTMAASAGGALNTQANAIVALTKPSASGQQAAMAVGAAARSLQQAAAAMKALGRTCDNYMNSVRK